MHKLRLAADFPDHVLWHEGGGAVSPEDLGISGELCRALRDWYNLWSTIETEEAYKRDEAAKIDWGLFDVKGIELWKRLRGELSGQYDVVYYRERFNSNFEEPSELEALLRNEASA
jgi:hypothetical protein